MESRALGRTGLAVTRFGLGLAALGRPGYINLGHGEDLHGEYAISSMQTQANAVLDAAWAEGVRYFDAARSYGRAEEFLANWLVSRQIRPASVSIGSKWGYTYTADWKVDADRHEIKDHSLATLRRQAAESKSILGGYLKLYQIHSATLESGVLKNDEVLQELAALKGMGWKVGLSVTGPRQSDIVQPAMDIVVKGERLFDSVQATWNLLEPSAGSALEQAHAAGMGVIVKEALANGRLTERNDDPAFAAKRTQFNEVAGRLGTTLDALALAAVLVQPWVDVVLSGAATGEQLRSNLAARTVQVGHHIEELLGALAESPDDYWSTRAHLPWN
jgi:aryl-alcohol dehydrogenase-like predicted oxidoreductase